MFVAHFASGLVFYIRKEGGKTAFLLLILGTQFVDLLWGLFVVFDIESGMSGGSVEHNYFDVPWSHSLLMMIVWSVLYGSGANYIMMRKNGGIENFGIYGGLSVFSHWFLDLIVHNDDMLLFPNSDATVPTLYLWEYPIATFIIELAIIVGCWQYYSIGLKNNANVSEYTKSQIMLGLLVLLHVFNFLPSFTDGDPMDSSAGTGIFVFIAILLIGFLMAWLHPDNESP